MHFLKRILEINYFQKKIFYNVWFLMLNRKSKFIYHYKLYPETLTALMKLRFALRTSLAECGLHMPIDASLKLTMIC